MTDQNMPDMPEGALFEAAIAQHEMYTAWVRGGFTEAQALELTKAAIVAILSGGGHRD